MAASRSFSSLISDWNTFFGRMLLVGNTIFHLGITQKDEAVQGTTKY